MTWNQGGSSGGGSIMGTPVDPASPGGSLIELGTETTGTLPVTQMTPWNEEEFTTTLAQTAFVLSMAPLDAQSIIFTLNGVVYDDVTDYSVSGSTITWLDTPFTIDAGEKVVIQYR